MASSRKPLQGFFSRVWWKGFQLFLRSHEVGRIEGIRLADFRKRGDDFLPTMREAIRLIQFHDPRRFARLKRHIVWISNGVPVSGGNAELHASEKWCVVDYFDPAPDTDCRSWAATWACVLIHEATHGLLEQKGFQYDGERRVRIEQICCSEQNGFAKRLQQIDPTTYGDLVEEFDPSKWQDYWQRSTIQRLQSFLHRQIRD